MLELFLILTYWLNICVLVVQLVVMLALLFWVRKISKKLHCMGSVPTRLVFYIDGIRRDRMLVNADKEYSVVLGGQDRDGNAVDFGATPVVLSLSDPSMGEITGDQASGFSLNPNKVGLVTLQAQAGELFGTLDLEIQPGALAKINVVLQEKVEAPAPEQPAPETPAEGEAPQA